LDSSAIHDPAEARARLAALTREVALPAPAELGEVFVERAEIGELSLFMVGLVARLGEHTVTGSAGGRAGFPVERAYFELIERLSLFLTRASGRALIVRDVDGLAIETRACARVFPEARPEARRVRSLSNGVALHGSWGAACNAALCELVERDLVLRSFAGESAPQPVTVDSDLATALRAHYALEAYAFAPRGARYQAAGLFLFPRSDEAPCCYGFGAAQERRAAVRAAEREALQRLAFLWGEEIPREPPAITATADAHQEYYLYPPHQAELRAWLTGARFDADRARTASRFDGEATRFVDLTPAELLGSLYVAKAVSARARVLHFGGAKGDVLHPVA
jgi:hypothetical protein